MEKRTAVSSASIEIKEAAPMDGLLWREQKSFLTAEDDLAFLSDNEVIRYAERSGNAIGEDIHVV